MEMPTHICLALYPVTDSETWKGMASLLAVVLKGLGIQGQPGLHVSQLLGMQSKTGPRLRACAAGAESSGP